MVLFENKGFENTPRVAQLVCDYIKKSGIKYVVMASKTGYTTDIFLECFKRENVDAKIVSVTHCYGD